MIIDQIKNSPFVTEDFLKLAVQLENLSEEVKHTNFYSMQGGTIINKGSRDFIDYRPSFELDVEIIEDCLPGRTTNIDDAQDGSHLNGAKVLMSSLLANSPIDLVIIMLGTNDLKIRFQRTPDAIAEGIKELINTVKNTNSGPGGWHDQNKSDLFIICPPSLNIKSNDTNWIKFNEWENGLVKSTKLYDSLKKVCEQNNVFLFDSNQIIQSSTFDPIHWSKKTHKIFAKKIAELIKYQIKL